MSKDEKPMHPNFVAYINDSVKNPVYEGLPYNIKANGMPSWVAPKTSKIGKARIEWVKHKAELMGIDTSKPYYSKVMFAIHPTKVKPCQVCGKEMSLYYVYPSKSFSKKLNATFNGSWGELDSLHDIVDELLAYEIKTTEIAKFLISEFSLSVPVEIPIHEIVDKCEQLCRNGSQAKLGPGAMSNFPDRFDGFHSYNRCCRAKEDKGRHVDNMNSYNKDRRAYELWSDGNIKAANSFMHSTFFKNSSADHIGPISLGFKHESFLLKKMPSGENSSKRDRLYSSDVDMLIEIEENHQSYCAISRQSTLIWAYIKNHYKAEKNLNNYQIALKQSTNNYLNILWNIYKMPSNKGYDFLIKNIIKPKFDDFSYSYEFDAHGNQINKSLRHITDATKKEWDRILRISFEALDDYHNKDNRNIKNAINQQAEIALNKLIDDITHDSPNSLNSFEELLEIQQQSLLKNLY